MSHPVFMYVYRKSTQTHNMRTLQDPVAYIYLIFRQLFVCFHEMVQQTIEFVNLAGNRPRVNKRFFNLIINLKSIKKLINGHYQESESITDRPSYDGIVLFKMI